MNLLHLATRIVLLSFISCTSNNKNDDIDAAAEMTERIHYFTFKKEYLFPGDSSLSNPEDGVALADGRVIVSDQITGLRLIQQDGSNRAFGNFTAAGFVHHPPDTIAHPNGLFLEHDQQHVLMCDVGNGKIFRTNIATEKVELIYDHPFGVNAIYRDKFGAIWFTQSGEAAGLSREVNLPVPNGAVFKMTHIKSQPVVIADSLCLPNGITMDRYEKTLFVAETMMNRVLSFEVDSTRAKVNDPGIAALIPAPDNIRVDMNARLFIASPASNKVIMVDFKNHSQHVIFDASTPEGRSLADEWYRRSQLGIPRAEVITAKMYEPLEGLLTGMFFSQDGHTLYVNNFGSNILRIDL